MCSRVVWKGPLLLLWKVPWRICKVRRSRVVVVVVASPPAITTASTSVVIAIPVVVVVVISSGIVIVVVLAISRIRGSLVCSIQDIWR